MKLLVFTIFYLVCAITMRQQNTAIVKRFGIPETPASLIACVTLNVNPVAVHLFKDIEYESGYKANA